MRSRSLRLDACLRSTRSGVADLGKDMWGFTNVPVRTVYFHVMTPLNECATLVLLSRGLDWTRERDVNSFSTRCTFRANHRVLKNSRLPTRLYCDIPIAILQHTGRGRFVDFNKKSLSLSMPY